MVLPLQTIQGPANYQVRIDTMNQGPLGVLLQVASGALTMVRTVMTGGGVFPIPANALPFALIEAVGPGGGGGGGQQGGVGATGAACGGGGGGPGTRVVATLAWTPGSNATAVIGSGGAGGAAGTPAGNYNTGFNGGFGGASQFFDNTTNNQVLAPGGSGGQGGGRQLAGPVTPIALGGNPFTSQLGTVNSFGYSGGGAGTGGVGAATGNAQPGCDGASLFTAYSSGGPPGANGGLVTNIGGGGGGGGGAGSGMPGNGGTGGAGAPGVNAASGTTGTAGGAGGSANSGSGGGGGGAGGNANTTGGSGGAGGVGQTGMISITYWTQ